MDENIEVDLKKEERTHWEEPHWWDVEKHGMFTVRKLNYKRMCLDIWMEVVDAKINENDS